MLQHRGARILRWQRSLVIVLGVERGQYPQGSVLFGRVCMLAESRTDTTQPLMLRSHADTLAVRADGYQIIEFSQWWSSRCSSVQYGPRDSSNLRYATSRERVVLTRYSWSSTSTRASGETPHCSWSRTYSWQGWAKTSSLLPRLVSCCRGASRQYIFDSN